VITAAPNQPVSVRTSRQGRTDWGPVVGSTDSTGRWSTGGQFGKSDFGSWEEIWTVGGKLASPVIQFSVDAPCLPGGRQLLSGSGPNMVFNCETTEGAQTFRTPSLSDSFRTPDGRLVPGRETKQTPEQYHMEVLQYLITSREKSMRKTRTALHSSRGGLGDETADLINRLIGVNALSEGEIRIRSRLFALRLKSPKPSSQRPGNRRKRCYCFATFPTSLTRAT
jgi:hypothetical protein